MKKSLFIVGVVFVVLSNMGATESCGQKIDKNSARHDDDNVSQPGNGGGGPLDMLVTPHGKVIRVKGNKLLIKGVGFGGDIEWTKPLSASIIAACPVGSYYTDCAR